MSIKGDVLPGGINQEIQGVTTQTRAHPDDFNPNVLKPLLDNDVTMSKQLETLPSEALTFRPGYQIVESEQDTPFRLGEVKGRTRINLLGNGANSLETWVSTRATHTKQDEFIKVTPKKEITHDIYIENAGQIVTTGGKYYVLVAEAYCENALTLLRAIAFNMNREVVADKRGSPIGGAAPGSAFLAFKTPANTASATCRVQILNTQADITNVPGNATVHFRNYRTYEISESDYNVISTMTPEQVAERYPYVDGMTNVTNPYAIVTGGNLLPPFYEASIINNASSAIAVTAPYSISIDKKNTGTVAISSTIPTSTGSTYTFAFDASVSGLDTTSTAVGLYYNVQCFDASGKQLPGLEVPPYIKENGEHHFERTFTITDPATVKINVVIGMDGETKGSFTISNPMLTIGTEPKPFTPQQRSMLAFETELAAHPVDGSNPDTLFMGDDGLPYVLEPWKKVALEGSLGWSILPLQDAIGFKAVITPVSNNMIGQGNHWVAKYDGRVLTYDNGLSTPDTTTINKTDGHLHVTIANTDSGWGPDYTPTADEIKAYFLGWKMYDRVTNPAGDGVYNRTDGVNKEWAYRNPDGGYGGGIATLPTSVSPRILDGTHDFYRLQYLKAKPTVEPVRNYEMGATLFAGSNMVEAGSGIVIRERAHVSEGATTWAINNKTLPASILKHRTDKIISVFTGAQTDKRWTIIRDAANAHGNYLAYILKSDGTYDPSAVYHVTYTMLDPTLAAPISGTVAANLRGTVSDLVQDVGDVQRRLSVVENKKAEKDKASPQWIKATLLNGWTDTGSSDRPVSYRKVGDTVEIDGILRGSNVTTGTIAFILPVGYRPFKNSNFIVAKSSTGGTTKPYARVLVTSSSGEVTIVPENDTINAWVSMNGIKLYTI